MTYDSKLGGLSFFWHDARNDVAGKATQYFYQIWTPRQLDEIVAMLAKEMGIEKVYRVQR